jgi:tripartite ATP-independent transporter DctM subunit
MFVLIAIRVPITFSLGLASLAFFVIEDISLVTFAQKLAVSVDSFSLASVPFFILAGNLMNSGGITRRLFTFANSLLGRIQGGLCYVTVVSSMIFSAMSGSSLANAAGLGTVQIKALAEQKYDKYFSACLVTSSAVMGPIIPPSVIMVVYGVITGVSIQKMFMGGAIPGVFFGVLLIIMCLTLGRRYDFPEGEKHTVKEIGKSFLDAIWALLAPVIILGGIFSGVFTATESGAIAAVYSMIVGVLVYKDMKLSKLKEVLMETAKSTATILLIAATATVLGFCLTYAQIPQQLAAYLSSVLSSKYALLSILSIVYLFLGCIMDATAIVITTVPIFAPLCAALGIDLVYFGVLVGILMSIGTVTPPVGVSMFVICKNTGLSIESFTKSMLPWYGMMLIYIVILIAFPSIISMLPRLIYG